MSAIAPDELLLLILRLLEHDPRLASAFAALRADAESAGLLGCSLDWHGATRPSTYERAIRRLGAPPDPAQLSHLLSHLVDLTRSSAASALGASHLPSAAWSLLRGGALALAPPISTARTQTAQWSALYRQPVATSTDVAVRRRSVHSGGGRVASLAARERGVRLPVRRMRPGVRVRRDGSEEPALDDGDLRALCAIVGHRDAVYCCCFDRTGARVFTGSDDMNVKIWCAQSGYLQHTCRGHTQAITEMAVSPCNNWLVRGAATHRTRSRIEWTPLSARDCA